jgi:drug/metabolite transporter (DMT)-like permease
MPQKIELVKHHKPAIGVPIVIVAAFFNAAMATMVKLILKETDLPNQMLVFFRFGISFFLLLPILFVLPKYRPIRETLKIKIWPPYVIRMIAGMLSLYAYFFALQRISLSMAVLLVYTSPLFIPVVAWVWKGSPIKPKLWWGLGIGFLGVSLIVGPKFENFQLGYFIGLIAGVLAAVSYVAARLQSYTEKPIAINFYFFLGASLIALSITAKSLIAAIPFISAKVWFMLFLMGLFGALFQGLVILALKWTQARFLGAFLYFAVGYAILVDWLLFHKVPGTLSILGLSFIVAGGIVMALLDPGKEKREEIPKTS